MLTWSRRAYVTSQPGRGSMRCIVCLIPITTICREISWGREGACLVGNFTDFPRVRKSPSCGPESLPSPRRRGSCSPLARRSTGHRRACREPRVPDAHPGPCNWWSTRTGDLLQNRPGRIPDCDDRLRLIVDEGLAVFTDDGVAVNRDSAG